MPAAKALPPTISKEYVKEHCFVCVMADAVVPVPGTGGVRIAQLQSEFKCNCIARLLIQRSAAILAAARPKASERRSWPADCGARTPLTRSADGLVRENLTTLYPSQKTPSPQSQKL